MAKAKPINHYPFTRESLNELDKETLIEMLLASEAQKQQLIDFARESVNNKYKSKNERFENPGQLLLFPGAHSDTEKPKPSTPETGGEGGSQSRPLKRKRSGHGRKPQSATLPRVPIFPDTPEPAQLACTGCGAMRVLTRRIFRHSRFQFIPASFYYEDLYDTIYSCPSGCASCKDLVASVAEPVKNGLAAPGLLAQVVVARDFDHTPFNRQSTIYNRHGAPLNRSTLSEFYAQAAKILTPLYMFMQVLLLQSKVISTDDTPVKVLDRSKPKNIKTGRQWAFLGDENHPVNLFHYTQGRGRDGPLEFLKGWKGRLQGDCFSGNIAICAAAGTILVACLAHARRYFIKALLNNKAGCNQALLMFQALYEIERTAKDLDLPAKELALMREQESMPILEQFHQWLQEQYKFAQPKSLYGKALFYCLNNWTALTQYVGDGDLKIDNNHTEREMKYIAMGRRAWLFFGSDKGARDHAIVLSILSTCRRHGVEPWAYLTDVIQRLAEDPGANLEELLPYNWKQRYPTKQTAEIPLVKDAPKLLCA